MLSFSSLFSYFFKPFCGCGFGDYGEYFYPIFTNVIKDAIFINAQSVLRAIQAAQPFYPTFTDFCRLMAQMDFH